MRFFSALLSFCLLGTAVQVRAEEVKTISLRRGGLAGGLIGKEHLAKCWSVNDGEIWYRCRAKRGYVFWVGTCSGSRRYLTTGYISKEAGSSYGAVEWCLREE